MAIQTDLKEISDHLASALGVEPSELLIGETRLFRHPAHRLGYTNPEIPFLYNGQEVAWAYTRDASDNQITKVNFRLPSTKETSSYAPFSLNGLEAFKIDFVGITYHIDQHPEFRELLEILKDAKRIPRQKLAHADEPVVTHTITGIEGSMQYFFGVPQRYFRGIPQEDGLCIKVDEKDKKYVPEAEEQLDQGHSCIHGESAPYNPFDPNRVSKVQIKLSNGNNNSDSASWNSTADYLGGFLESLPVPADGLHLEGYHNGQYGLIRSKTPSDPFIDVWLYNVKSKENWENKVALARRIEEMFKVN